VCAHELLTGECDAWQAKGPVRMSWCWQRGWFLSDYVPAVGSETALCSTAG